MPLHYSPIFFQTKSKYIFAQLQDFGITKNLWHTITPVFPLPNFRPSFSQVLITLANFGDYPSFSLKLGKSDFTQKFSKSL